MSEGEPVAALLLASLRQGRRVVMRALGGSMEPAIPSGSRVRIDPCEAALAGEIVAIERPDGGLALHRVVKVFPDGSVLTWGDAMPLPDRFGRGRPLGRVQLIDTSARRSLRFRLTGAIRARAHVALGTLLPEGLTRREPCR